MHIIIIAELVRLAQVGSNCATSGQDLNLLGPLFPSLKWKPPTLQGSREGLQGHTWLFHTIGSVCALPGLPSDRSISPAFLLEKLVELGLWMFSQRDSKENCFRIKRRQMGPDIVKAYLLGLQSIFIWTTCHKQVVGIHVGPHVLQVPSSLPCDWLWARKFTNVPCVRKFHFSPVFWTQHLPVPPSLCADSIGKG